MTTLTQTKEQVKVAVSMKEMLIAVKKQANIAANDGLWKWCLTRSFCN
jgi:hypothetical protein